ncbi:MAG: hydrolase [Myxococcota bacterium]
MTDPKTELLTPDNCALIIIDYQPQMTFGVQSHDRQAMVNNIIGLTKGAKTFNIPTVLTTVESKNFSGHMFPEILDIFPENPVFERTSMNTWDDVPVKEELKRIGRKKLVFTALWSEVCLTFPILEAMRDGYECYAVADSSGGTSLEAHERAMDRVTQAGAVPLTWMQTVLEWQRDWSKKEHYDEVMNIMRAHAGAFGQGIEYAHTIVHKAPPSRKR